MRKTHARAGHVSQTQVTRKRWEDRYVAQTELGGTYFRNCSCRFRWCSEHGALQSSNSIESRLRPSESPDMLLGLCVASGRQRRVS
jgi:hypothetical protein